MSDLKETLDITKERNQGKKESNGEFSVRLATAIAGIDEDGWDDLSTDVQSWFNGAVVELNKRNPDGVEDFPGLESKSSGTKGRATLNTDDKSSGTKETTKRGKRGSKAKADDTGSAKSTDPFKLAVGDSVKLVKASGVEIVGDVTKTTPERVYVDKGGSRATGVLISSIDKAYLTGEPKADKSRAKGGGKATVQDMEEIEFDDLDEIEEDVVLSVTDVSGNVVTGKYVSNTKRAVTIYDTESDSEVRISKSKIKTLFEVAEQEEGTSVDGAGSGIDTSSVLGYCVDVVLKQVNGTLLDIDETVEAVLDGLDSDSVVDDVDALEEAVEAFVTACGELLE